MHLNTVAYQQDMLFGVFILQTPSLIVLFEWLGSTMRKP
jgi:hypothetical protein